MFPSKRALFVALALLTLAAVLAAPAHAQNATLTEDPKPEMTWQSWVVVCNIAVLLIALVLDLVPPTSALILTAMFLYLCEIVTKKDLFVGMTNNGVLSIAILFIIVGPIAELPLMKKLVVLTLSGAEGGSYIWPLFKLSVFSLVTSSFIENTPHVAMFTPLVTKFCIEHDLAPSQLLLPMNYAVILGNYAVVGCSSNLVFSGLMQDAGLGQMDFFELAKIGAPQLIPVALYLTFMPQFLLPFNKGTAATVGDERGGSPLKIRVMKRSMLIGKKYKNIASHFPGGKVTILGAIQKDTFVDLTPQDSPKQTTEPIEESLKDGETVGADDGLSNVSVEEGDIISIKGNPSYLNESAVLLKFDFVTANMHLASEQAFVYTTEHDQELEEIKKPEAEEKNDTDDIVAVSKPAPRKLLLHEVVLSAGCPTVGSTVESRVFQHTYSAPILAIRASRDGSEVPTDSLPGHVLEAGDTMMILAPSTFAREYNQQKEFLLVTPFRDTVEDPKTFVFMFPKWFPLGSEVQQNGETKKVVILPPEYSYITLLIFLLIVIAAVFHWPLAVLCLGGAILYVLLGICTTRQAIKMIHLDVYVLVAFSFPLGVAVKSSGLAKVIGQLIADADISGFSLLLVISIVSVVMANLITNKAACQVMFPIIVAVYKAQDADPLPAIMVSTTVVCFALCTPYGIPPNVIVMGPGQYTGMDYLKFGLPITILCTVLTPLFAAAVYDTW